MNTLGATIIVLCAVGYIILFVIMVVTWWRDR